MWQNILLNEPCNSIHKVHTTAWGIIQYDVVLLLRYLVIQKAKAFAKWVPQALS